jgi:hypothetical protein
LLILPQLHKARVQTLQITALIDRQTMQGYVTQDRHIQTVWELILVQTADLRDIMCDLHNQHPDQKGTAMMTKTLTRARNKDAHFETHYRTSHYV